MEIRIAQTSDAKKWIDLLISCLGDDYQVKQIYDSEFVSSLLNPKSSEETYIVDVNDELIASITVFKPVEFVNNPVMNIGRILIKPQSLSDGSAKLLFDTIQKIANEQKQNIVACVPAYAYELQVFFENCGYICVGFQPCKHTIQTRKDFLFYVLKIDDISFSRTVISESLPQIGELASCVLESVGIVNTLVSRDGIAGYPLQTDIKIHSCTIEDFVLWKIQAQSMNPIPEIAICSNRGVGLLQIPSSSSSQAVIGQRASQIVSGMAYFFDDIDRCVAILDGFAVDDISTGAMLKHIVQLSQDQYSAAYVEADFLATSPRLLKCAEQLGFVPVAYFPSFFRIQDRVSDVVKMVKYNMSYTPEKCSFTSIASKIVKLIEFNLQDLKTGVAIINLLRGLPIFDGLGDGELRKIARLFTQKLYHSGERIFNRGDTGEEAYIVMRGQIDICLSEDSKPIASIENGKIFGEQAFLDGAERTAMAIASKPSILLLIKRNQFNELVQREPHLGMVVMRNIAMDLSGKLRRVNQTLIGIKS